MNHERLEAYNDMVEKLGGEISTYTETTGNGGVHNTNTTLRNLVM